MKALIKHYLARIFTTLLILDAVLDRVWPRKVTDEPVTQPIPIKCAPAIIPMPTVHLEPVDLPMIAPLMPTPYADVMDQWLRAEQRAMQEKLRGNDEDGDGVEV